MVGAQGNGLVMMGLTSVRSLTSARCAALNDLRVCPRAEPDGRGGVAQVWTARCIVGSPPGDVRMV
ncbi:MAG: hypothetical protein QOG10_3902 [Kribbellaceae bacterium]|nr:hypothetical protein [Kribbellaceae bacterium]